MDHLRTESSNPASANLDELTSLELVRLMNAEDALVIPAVASQAGAIARAIEIIAQRLRQGGRLVYVGAGTSGRLGVLDAAECPPTFNSLPEQVVGVICGGPGALTRAVEGAEDHPESADLDLQAIGLRAADVLVGIATSGRTPYVLGAIDYAHRQGAFTIGLACNPDAELIGRVDLAITPVVGPEILSGSTRLKAGTATKLVLNMLSTGAMVKLNKTFGNLMVDLRVTNEKLAARANRIVRQLTGLDKAQADGLLQQCGGEVKTALVSQLAGVTPDEARQRLQAAGGKVREVLKQVSATSGPASKRPATDLFLGIDGGGTHTVAILARAHAVAGLSEAANDSLPLDSPLPAKRGWTLVGRGEAGPSNMKAVGGEKALAALDQATANAFAAAGLPRVPVAAACLGLAGAGRPEDQAFIRAWADRIGLAVQTEVTTDANLLLAAGTPDSWGAAVIAGTGSMVFVRDAGGRTARAGGWGHLLGDEGSGYALALAALRAVARAADQRDQPTILTERILRALNIDKPQALIATVYSQEMNKAALAGLAPLVLAAADEGDPTAAAIVQKGAAQLAATVAAAVRQLGSTSWPGLVPASVEANVAVEKSGRAIQAIPLALAGGLFTAAPNYRNRMLQALRSLGLQGAPVSIVTEPAEGAVRLAVCFRR